MPAPRPLIGRNQELGDLREKLKDSLGGEGSLVLLCGETGVGKTRLLDELCGTTRVSVLRGAARQETTSAYGPVVAALRSALRADPDALSECGPLTDSLAVLLPELGPAGEEVDTMTLRESLRAAFAAVADDAGALVVLDDLQWSDAANLEFLAEIAPTLDGVPLLIVGAYRSDELPRDHPLRRTRNDLRRKHALHEISVERLDPEATQALLEAIL